MANNSNFAEKTSVKLQSIDFALLAKLAKSLDIPPRQWDKIMAHNEFKKREVELVKYILKSSLLNNDDVAYRLREQKYGGFSITIVGNLVDEWVKFLRSDNINELRHFYSRTEKAEEFENVYNEFVEIQRDFSANRGNLTIKTNGATSLYSRMVPGYWGSTGYRTERDSNYDLLYTKILWLIKHVNSMLLLTGKLVDYRSNMNYEDISHIELQNSTPVENLVSVSNEYIFEQLASVF